MSTPKGTTFVLLVAAIPPAAVVLRVLIDPRYLIETHKSLLALYLFFYYVAVRYITVPYFTSPLRALPQPPGEHFILGHGAADFEPPRGSRFLKWIDVVPNDGIIYVRGFFHAMHALLLTTPEALYEVLVTNSYDFEKPLPGRALLGRTIGRGLINTEGAEHKFLRKGVTPAFTGKQIRDLVPIFWSKSRELFNHIANTQLNSNTAVDEKSGYTGRTGVVEINQWASRVTLDIIGLACVGRDFNSIGNSDDDFVQQYEKILRTDDTIPIFYAICTIFVPLAIARWTPFWTRFRQASDGRYRLRQLCKGLIEVKRRDMEAQDSKHIDILSVLIRNGQFTDDQLVSQLLTFLAAG